MNINEKLKNRRLQLGLTMLELSQKVGVSEATISRWESGDIANMKRDKIISLANALKVEPSFVMGWEPEKKTDIDLHEYGIEPIKKKKFRMLGEIACGEPIYCDEAYETYVEASEDINADFCLIAKGDSMINARIYDGDVVFIKEQPIVDNGEIAAVIIDNEATLKRVYYYRNENKLVLAAENPHFPPLVYVNEELNSIRILGRATAFMSYVK